MLTKKLIKETKQLINLRFFLNECGLSKVHLSSKALRKLLKALTR